MIVIDFFHGLALGEERGRPGECQTIMGARRVYRHDYPLQVEEAAIPLPPVRETHTVQAEVHVQIYKAVKRLCKSERRSMREIIEWGFCSYLWHSSPKVAERLGIKGPAEKSA